MLSVADIPMCGNHFTGVIGVVCLQNKEYRLATYLGARVERLGNGSVSIRQGDMLLEAKLADWGVEQSVRKKGKGLQAPVLGEMNRTIHEHVVSHAAYRFQKGKEVCLSFESDRAAFEYEYRC